MPLTIRSLRLPLVITTFHQHSFGVRWTARIVQDVQLASKFPIPGIVLSYIGNRMILLQYFR
jgi:hypothetical protein